MFSFYIFSITLPAVRISLLFKSELWYSRFYWSRSTKDPADPYWFVVVLPSQVFLIMSYHHGYHRLSPSNIALRISMFNCKFFVRPLVDDCFSAFGPLEKSLLIVFRSPVSCSTCGKIKQRCRELEYGIGRIKWEDTSVTQKGRRRNLVSQAWPKLLLFFNQILSFCKRPEQRKDKYRTRTVTFVACYTFGLVA